MENVNGRSPIFSKTSYLSDSGMLGRFLWERSVKDCCAWREENIRKVRKIPVTTALSVRTFYFGCYDSGRIVEVLGVQPMLCSKGHHSNDDHMTLSIRTLSNSATTTRRNSTDLHLYGFLQTYYALFRDDRRSRWSFGKISSRLVYTRKIS